MTVAEIGEIELVQRIRRLVVGAGLSSAVEIGPGDDAAVVGPVSGQLVLSVDSQREHVHFERQWLEPEALGYRAIAVALSDLAAMGADPGWILAALAIPGEIEVGWIEALVGSMAAAAAEHGAPLVGGDVAGVDSGVSIEITVAGVLPPGRQALRRDTVRAGDDCWVTGHPGLARAGLELIRSGVREGSEAGQAVEAFRHPTPRLALGAALAAASFRCAAMDLSDGLALDLTRMCRASDVGVEIEAKALRDALLTPLLGGAQVAAEWVLGGGEDYELLLGVAPEDGPALQALCARQGVPVRCIGSFRGGKPVARLRQADGGLSEPVVATWSHFGGGAR